jgi:hypothetical protein
VLPTSAGDVASEVSEAIAAACASIASVRAAYVCRIRREDPAQSVVEELLKVAVETLPPRAEKANESRKVLTELLLALPDAVRDGGLSNLAEAAVPAWREFGICVFERA